MLSIPPFHPAFNPNKEVVTHMMEDARRIIDDSIRAVLPDAAVYRALEGRRFDRPVTVIAIGKAAWRMANAAAKALGENLREGIVITKYGHSEGDIPRMTIYEAAHPIPDEAGVAATRAALALADRMTAQDEVIFLVSGGGSALFEQPLEGVTLDDCAEITRQLLACGADIVQINTIRKHLSAVKGGRFAQRCAPAHVLAIVLSDVLGDSLDSIASGPCYPDRSTCRDVEQLVERYHLVIPPHVLPALQTETPKQLHNVETQITGNVRALCDAAKASAEALGYRTLTLTTTLNCEAREAGAMLASVAREIRQSGQPLGFVRDLLLYGLGLCQFAGIFLGLSHQHTNLLAEPVAVSAELVGLLNVSPALSVQRNDLVHHRQLLVLEFFLDVFLHQLRIFPDKLDVQHTSFLLKLRLNDFIDDLKWLPSVQDTAAPGW